VFWRLAVFGGYVLNRPIGGGAVVQALAWALAAVWLAITTGSIAIFRRVRTSMVPIRPATMLVISGPYDSPVTRRTSVWRR
jgi:hypothetical protein